MKKYALQLVTVDLGNGQRGVFIGEPLITSKTHELQCQVEDIWFSNIQEVPDELTLTDLVQHLRGLLCCGKRQLQ